MLMSVKNKIIEIFNEIGGGFEAINEINKILYELCPVPGNPVGCIQWIPIEKVTPNDYNPNSVASKEMELLLKSIAHDGYTQPIVTIYDQEKDKYVIIDGFHRYFVGKSSAAIGSSIKGHLPCVVISSSINDRMASTVRHNRARGKHSIDGMSNLVFKMLDQGWLDEQICNELGMEPEELLRLKHITGFSKLFEDTEYHQSWVVRSQILIKKHYDEKHKKKDEDEKKTI